MSKTLNALSIKIILFFSLFLVFGSKSIKATPLLQTIQDTIPLPYLLETKEDGTTIYLTQLKAVSVDPVEMRLTDGHKEMTTLDDIFLEFEILEESPLKHEHSFPEGSRTGISYRYIPANESYNIMESTLFYHFWSDGRDGHADPAGIWFRAGNTSTNERSRLILGLYFKYIHEKIPTKEDLRSFYRYIEKKDIKSMLMYINKGYPVSYKPTNEMTALLTAIRTKSVDVVQLLVENGADINDPEQSILEDAIDEGSVEILEYLLTKGATSDNYACLFSYTGDREDKYLFAKCLLMAGANQHCDEMRGKIRFFIEAIKQKDYEALDKLQFKEGEIDDTDYTGITGLITAIQSNDPKMVKYLLKRGADKKHISIDTTYDDDVDMPSPLEYAKSGGNKKIIKLIE